MKTNSRAWFHIRADMFDSLTARTILERLPAGLNEAELNRLDWHIRNAAQAVSGTAQLASYNGLVDFIASHYAKLLGVPQGDDLNDLTIRIGINGGLSRLRKTESGPGLQEAYRALVSSIAAFWSSATEPPDRRQSTDKSSARRRVVASAIWQHRRVDDDMDDVDLKDLPDTHTVWTEADAVLKALDEFNTPAADASRD